ncbi:MAG: hypothetical protein GY769_23540 [bacterium]|nr:hypothetical protein [bacterium]
MLRPLIWSPALIALVVVVLLAVLGSARFARWAERFAEARAGSYLNRQVEIGSVSIDLIPLSIEARDLVIGGPGDGEPAFAEVERLQVDARMGSLLRPGVTLHRVFVEKPLIRVNFDESGQHDAPRTQRRRFRDQPRRFEIAIGSIEVVDGELETEHRKYPLEVSARDLRANLAGGDDRLELVGQLRADEVTVVLPQARPYLGTVSVLGSYRPGRAEIAAGSFEAPDVAAEVRGFVQWRGERRTSFSIEASGQGRLLDRLGYGDGLVDGPFDFVGEFVRGEREWSLSGGLSSTGIEVVERRVSSVSGRVQVDSEGARYRIESARYGRGTIDGSVRMALGSENAPVELDLQLSRVDVGRLLEDQRIPIIGLAAEATGNFSYQFLRRQPRSGNGWADLKIERTLGAEGLPVDGSAVLSIGDGRLRTEAVRLTGEDQLIVATGSYDMAEGSGSFDVEVTSEAIEAVLALLPMAEPGALWQPERGRGEVVAEVIVDGEAVQVLTELNLEDVEAPGFRADRVQGRFELDPVGVHDLRVELLRPTAGLIVTGSVPLVADVAADGDDDELLLAVDAEGWPLSDLQPWLPFEMPLQGPFSGGATIRGSPEAPEGSARGRVAPPSLGKLEASRLDFDLDFSPERVVFHEAELGFGQGAIRLSGDYDLLADRMALAVDSDRLDLSALEMLPISAERLAGTLEVSGELGGSITNPDLALVFGVESVAIDDAVLGETGSGELRLEWHGRDIESEGGIEGLVRLAGGGVLEDGVADLEFEVSSSDLRAILALFLPQAVPDFEATGQGSLRVAGALGAARLPAVRLRLDELLIRRPGLRAVRTLENLEPVSIVLDGGVLVLDSFYLATPDAESEFFVAGRIGLEDDKTLDLKMQCSLGASWFEPWAPEGIELVEGTFDVIGSIVGTVSEPRLDGVGEFSGGKLVSTGFAATFESTEAVFLFYPRQAVLDQLSARVVGGRLNGAGTVGWTESGELDYRFQISGDGLNFRYPEGWSIRGNTDFTLSSSPGGRQLSGALDLDRALYVTDVPVELDQLLRSFFEQRRVEVEETDELLTTTQLNLAVTADETLRIRNNLADLRGSADLVLRGSLARPVVFGTVEFDPSGRLIYSGNEYELERGLLTFANPYRLEPVIDLVAHTGLREYDVTLSLSGTPERLSFDFISDPPLAELEVMALMTGGRPRDPEFGETRESQSLQGENLGAETFLYGQATSLVANRFNRLFGLDQFRIVPLTSSTGDLSSARVTVGKQLSRDLFATYSYDPSETEEQILELEWSISRSLILVLTQNGDGTYAVDAKWEKAF